MHIVDMVYFWARAKPLHPAIIEQARKITYAGLAQAVEAAAENFARNIPDKSRPVALSVPTGSKMLVALFGLLRGGFNVVLANKGVFEELRSVNANTLVFERGGATLDGGTNIPFDDNWLNMASAKAKSKSIPITRTTDTNILCFTSGTTGRPKPIVCPQRSWQQRVLFPLNSAFTDYERMLIVPGLITSWGLSRAYEALHAGRTVCLASPGEPTLWLLNTYDIDTMLASPQQVLELAEIQEKSTKYPLPMLKAIQIGAAYISRQSAQRVQKALCRKILMFYGSTEAGVAALAPYDMIADVPGAVGYIMPGVEVQTVDAMDRVLPLGKEGFVRVRSPVFVENMAASGSSDQWFYPGDIGSITEAGMLCIAGRSNEVVNRGGEKLAIADIENFLKTCFGVKDAGICTVTGPSGFSEVWVGLVLTPTADVGPLRQAIDSNAQYKNNIDKIFVVETIPRGTLGKIQRDELKKMLQAIAGEAGSTA